MQLLNATNARAAAERKLEAAEQAAAETAGAAERAHEAAARHPRTPNPNPNPEPEPEP